MGALDGGIKEENLLRSNYKRVKKSDSLCILVLVQTILESCSCILEELNFLQVQRT